ncbi:MAG: Fic family protein [Planctomycetaceae bacterium]|jgi:cell filamentation protein|nr:Fic family protein [Planctomycetaceae bacterium]
MKNEYQYIDPDFAYTDPKTGMLRNKANIGKADLLIAFESLKVMNRLDELEIHPIKIKDSLTLLAVHKYLFQDIYDWAGESRTVEISKGGKQFFPLSHFSKAFYYIDTLISEYRQTDKNDKQQLASKLADILDTVNFLHPFREGNGRTQREFLRLLAIEKNLTIRLNPPDNADVYERYMSGTINGDVQKLSKLIFELIEE